MTAHETKNEPGTVEPRPDLSGVQQESDATSESASFSACVEIAGLYLRKSTVYLGYAAAAVLAWKHYWAGSGEEADAKIWLLAVVLALPLLAALFFDVLPARRRRRERNLRPLGTPESGYFTTAPREADPYRFFAKGYEPFLEWAASPKEPLLHLSGLSGSGKSSVISAYLTPRLAAMETGPKTTVLVIRSYTDPLAAMKKALQTLWKKTPAGFQEVPPLTALRHAAHQVHGSDRILVVFDQFEEFFLLRTVAPEIGEKDGQAGPSSCCVAETEIVPLRDFLHAFVADPPERAAILLSYREDHRRLLAPLDLPARKEGQNWMTVDPFDFAAAADFLRSCPGLKVPEDRMKRVLREAARQEGGRVIMRPIVANLLGLIVQRMSGHPTLWRSRGDLLRGYVRDCLGEEIKEERARVLRVLLTDFHTARPRSVTEVARETGLEPTTIDVLFEHFGHAGLLRCLTPDESDLARRTWQIAHDFLAVLIERVLEGMHRTFWRTVRPWLTPAAVAIALVAGLSWPWVEKHRTISFLANEGFTWNEPNRAIETGTYEGWKGTHLEDLQARFQRLKPCALNLSNCSSLEDVNGLGGLASLRSLKISYCDALHDVGVLKDLTELRTLDICWCYDLTNVDAIENLTKLEKLALIGCDVLQDVSFIRGLTTLRNLDLSSCARLQDVNGLGDLVELRSLVLFGCTELRDVSVIKRLTNLETLSLGSCARLDDVTAVEGLTKLRHLDLSGLAGLKNAHVVKGLIKLETLDVSDCTGLQNVDGVTRLTSLKDLDLIGCDSLPEEICRTLLSDLPRTRIRFPNGSVHAPP